MKALGALWAGAESAVAHRASEVVLRMNARPRLPDFDFIGPAPGWLERPTVAQRRPRSLWKAQQHELRPKSMRGVSQPTALGLATAVDLAMALCPIPDCNHRRSPMEDLGLQALRWHVAGIEVRRMLHVVTAQIERPDGAMQHTTREFGGLRCDCRVLAEWLKERRVEPVAIEIPRHWGHRPIPKAPNAAFA